MSASLLAATETGPSSECPRCRELEALTRELEAIAARQEALIAALAERLEAAERAGKRQAAPVLQRPALGNAQEARPQARRRARDAPPPRRPAGRGDRRAARRAAALGLPALRR